MGNPYIYHFTLECCTLAGVWELWKGSIDYPVQLTFNEVRIMAESEAPMRFVSFGVLDIIEEEYRKCP